MYSPGKVSEGCERVEIREGHACLFVELVLDIKMKLLILLSFET